MVIGTVTATSTATSGSIGITGMDMCIGTRRAIGIGIPTVTIDQTVMTAAKTSGGCFLGRC
jgi:hypothetical protein